MNLDPLCSKLLDPFPYTLTNIFKTMSFTLRSVQMLTMLETANPLKTPGMQSLCMIQVRNIYLFYPTEVLKFCCVRGGK